MNILILVLRKSLGLGLGLGLKAKVLALVLKNVLFTSLGKVDRITGKRRIGRKEFRRPSKLYDRYHSVAHHFTDNLSERCEMKSYKVVFFQKSFALLQ